ncbi:hypothetical protein O0L34_g19492 [Tuta absoluta]|nr:hypothetical protein O0L34_g19492 [Tuta absoluta]
MNKSASESNISQSGERSPLDSSNTCNRRKREDYEVTLADFEDFKVEMRDMINTLIAQNSAANITPTLKTIQDASTSIASSVEFLTKQNEDFRKEIIRLESQHKDDKNKYFCWKTRLKNCKEGNVKAPLR